MCIVCSFGSCCCCGLRMLTSAGVRIMYALFFLLVVSIAWIMRSAGIQTALERASNKTNGIIDFGCGGDSASSCLGVFASYRVILGLVYFHAILVVFTFGSTSRGDVQGSIHASWWPLKFLVLFGIIIGNFFVSDDVIANFYYGAYTLAFIFILLHIIILLGGAYNWSDSWAGQQENDRRYAVGLLCVTFIFFACIVALTVFLYLNFTQRNNCEFDKFVISLNIILFVVAAVLSVLPKVQDKNQSSGLLQVALLCAFQTYLLWSGLSSKVNDSCNNYSSFEDSQKVSIYVGMALLFVAVIWHITNADRRRRDDLKESTHWAKIYAEDEGEETTIRQAEPEYNYSLFHAVLALAACYALMVITNWNHLEKRSGEYFLTQSNDAYWTNLVLSWVTWLVMFWAMIAPCCCPDREFGY